MDDLEQQPHDRRLVMAGEDGPCEPAAATTGRSPWVLRLLLGAAIVESFVHYADNTVRYDDYTVDDPSFLGSLVQQWVIPVAWILFTVAGLIGYRRFRDGRRPEAAAWLGAYSVSGLISVLHYVDISVDDLSAFQNTFVFLDVALGTAVLGFAVWAASTARDRSPARTAVGGRG